LPFGNPAWPLARERGIPKRVVAQQQSDSNPTKVRRRFSSNAVQRKLAIRQTIIKVNRKKKAHRCPEKRSQPSSEALGRKKLRCD